MNNQPASPLIPQGSLLDQKNKGRARVKVAVFLVLAVHGIGLMALLMQGCRREEPDVAQQPIETNAPAPPEFAPAPPPAMDTNLSTAPAASPPTTAAPPAFAAEPAPAPLVAEPPVTTSEYSVVAGDTPSGIAKKFHVSLKALMDANPGLEPTRMQIGQKIVIPPPTPPTPTPPTPESGNEVTYVVKSGDSLSRIASQYKTTVSAIRTANGLRTDRIRVGDKLTIPVKAPTPTPAPAPAPTQPALEPLPGTAPSTAPAPQ